MLVYVLNINGQPLMPTSRCGKVRRLLKEGKAKVKSRCPFTIQLLYKTKTEITQPIALGIDAGSKTIGLSSTTDTKVLYEAEVTVRNDIVELLSSRRELRNSRRNRKTRYRKNKFLDKGYKKQMHTNRDGWLAPSIRNKIQSHLTMVDKVCKLLPVTSIVAEVAAFDTQLLKAIDEDKPLPSGTGYQNGEMVGYNTREYVLFRDNHQCRCCKGKSKDLVLQTHHIESRKTGGNAPNNLVTLCKTCHDGYHAGTVILPADIKRGNKYNDAAFMSIMRWAFYNQLKETYILLGVDVSLTYGYITKHRRIENKLPKEHYIDARCISGHPMALSDGDNLYNYKKIRCHNRQLHKLKILKGGYRKNNQAPKIVKGYQLFDKVLHDGKEYTIFGRRTSGFFDIRTADGTRVNNGSISSKKLKLLNHQQSYIIERRLA